jgi:hypothetical protein
MSVYNYRQEFAVDGVNHAGTALEDSHRNNAKKISWSWVIVFRIDRQFFLINKYKYLFWIPSQTA